MDILPPEKPKKSKTPIEDFLGIQPTPSQLPVKQEEANNAISEIMDNALQVSLTEDFEFARSNIKNSVHQLNDSITKLSLIAEASQQARAYEVLGGLIKINLDASKALMDLYSSFDGVASPSEKSEIKQEINNNVLVMTTDEFAKRINNMVKGNKKDLDEE